MMAFLIHGAVAAQQPSVVEARMVLATDATRAGSTAKAAVVAQISPGYHINDNKPTLDYLIPTELQLEPSKEVSVTKLVYPKGELKSFAFSDAKLSVYEGTLEVGALLKIARTTRPGTYTLKGKFAYQACNDHACLPPRSVPVTLAVKVVPRGAPVKRVNGDVFDRISFE
jgi:DsbC/DsbD-like thiol-disulfide interchange protein